MFNRASDLVRKSQSLFPLSLMAIFGLITSAAAVGQTTVSPATVPFGNVVEGTASAPHTVTFKNTGASSVSLTSETVTAGSPYSIASSSTCLATPALASGASCTVIVQLTPAALGAQPAGTLTIVSSSASSPQSVALSGTGVAPTAVSASAVGFGSVVINTTSAAKTITLYNYQLVPVTISSITAPAHYAVSGGTCQSLPGGVLAASGNCTVSVTLTPAAAGAVPVGSLTITTNASNSPNTVALTGTGIEPTSASTTAVNFGNVLINSVSTLKTVTVTNSQSTSLTVASLVLTAGTPYAIDPSSTCLTPAVAAGGYCTVNLSVAPTTIGTQPAGTLTISTNAPNSPLTVALSATGMADTVLSPTSLIFGSVPANSVSATKTITIKNNDTVPLSITQAIFNGPFALDTTSVIANECPISGGAVSGSLASGASCVIGVTFNPTTTGSTSGGKVTIIDSDPSGPISAALSGVGAAPTSLSATAIGFGNVVVNTTSATKSVSVINNQAVALSFSSITAPSPYSVTTGTNACSTSTPLAAHSNCTVYLTYSPASLGVAAAASLTINDNAASGPTSLTATLTGAGIAPVTLNASTMAFGTVVIDQQATKSLTLTNNQSAPLTINSITGFAGGYTLDAANTTCPLSPATLPAAPTGNTCVISVDLTATALGSQPGTITITDSAANSPQNFALSGTAIHPVVLSVTSVAFAAQFEGDPSAPKSITLTNEQNVPLTISSANITGTNPGDFHVSSTTCPTAPSTLNAAPTLNTCTISILFNPTASGVRSATLSIADNATGSPQTVALSGTGNAPVILAPTTITSFTAPVGTTSAYKTITLTNAQPVALSNINLTVLGDFIISATTCPTGAGSTLAAGPGPGNTCTISVEFDPTIGGTRNGQLQVSDSAITTPQIVNLSGTGTSPLTISPAGLAFSAQLVGTVSPAKLITLTNRENEAETFSLVPTGDYAANSNCPTGGIPAHSTCNIYVNFTPSSVTPATRSGSLSIVNSAPNGSPVTASLTGSATATPPAAAVAVVSPGAGAAGTAVNVVITGNGWTHFSASSTINFYDTASNTYAADIAVTSQTLVSTNQINATLQITGGAGVEFGARNIVVRTPLSGGGTETADLLSAFIIADPTNQHEITAVSPAFGTQGQTLNVALTGSGTSWLQGTTFANFGDGVTVNSLTITDATDAIANITISNTTPIGYRTITMVTGGEFDVSVLSPSSNPIFQIGPNNATLVSVSPNNEPQGWSGQVTLTATGTHFLQNATQVTISGAIVGDVNVTSPTVAVAEVAVPAGAPLGLQNVVASTGGEITGLNNAFTITGATPALLSITPSSGVQGQSYNVVITGNAYTNFVAGQISADFDGNISTGTIVVNSPNQVTIPITISSVANVGSITANLLSGPTGSVTLFPFTFTVTPSSAAITGVTPPCVPQGGQLTLTVTGINTIWNQPQTTANFYPVPVPAPVFNEITIISPASAQLAVSVPTNTPPGTYGFYMSTGGQIVSSSINVCANTPTLTMSPANGLVPAAGTNSFSVSFTGQFTHFSQTATLPVIAGEGVTLSNFTVNNKVGATGTINITAGAATGARLVTFTTGGEIVTTYFNVTTTPVGIISISPYHGPKSTTMNVEIVGLNTHFNGSTTQVQFGPQITVNSVTVNSATDLVANITTSYLLSGVLTPTPSGYQTAYVNTGSEQVLTGFSVDYPATPSIVSVVPGSAAQSSTANVTITGSLTNWVQGTSELILGAGVTVADLNITSPTTATATISVSPTAPVGGNSVIMITGSEIDSGTGFSVTPGGASIVSVEPNFVCPTNFTNNVAGFNCNNGGAPTGVPVVAQLQTVTLNVVGVGTHWLQGETTLSFGGGVNVDKLTVTSPTTAQVQITILSSAPVGFATATADTDGEVASLVQAIDIEEGSPTLLAISPNAGEQDGSLTVQILGRFTHFSQTATNVAFNQDITVNSINVIDSENMQASITVSPWAYVDYATPCGHVLTVTTGNEQVSTAPILDNFCVQQGAEEITSVSPLQGIQGSTLQVQIIGSATNFVAGETQVSFGDPNFAVGQITVNNATSLTVPVAISTAATNGFKTITVTTLGQVASQQYSFTVDPGVATLNEAIPNQAEQGSPLSGQPPLVVRLIGQYSHFSASSTATFGAGITVQSVAYISPTEVDATITIDPLSYIGGRLVTVDTPNVPCSYQPVNAVAGTSYPGCTPGSSAGTGSEIVTDNAFSIIAGPAIITAISPATGNEGQEVVATITGSGTHWAQNFTQFYIAGGGSDITVNSVVINSPTSATVDLSISPTANPGARSIYMVTNGESLTDSGAFVVTGGIPVISYVSPSSALQGTTGLEVTVVGNAYTQWTTGTTVSFGPGVTVESFQVDDASHIEAVLNIAANAQVGYRTVIVQTGTQGLTGYFQVTAPAPPPTPYIWYENPSSGIPGQTLTISFSGAYTHWDPNPTTGTQLTGFAPGITLNSFQVTSPTSALANITISPSATASVSDLTLTTDTATPQEVDNAQFSVVVAQPTLSVVDPGSGIQGATNLTVNIIGQFTAFDNTTTFNFGSGITVNGPPVILGPTIATQSISIGIETPTGGYAVTASTPDATTANQVSVGGAGFSVTPSLALISAISPNTALQGNTITVNVTGENTHWSGATVFQFGAGIVVTTTTVNTPTTATLTLAIPPLASEGPTYATATTAGEVAHINNGFVVQAGTPQLLSSGPGSLPQQSSAIFTILSQATNWTSANPPVVSYGDGVVLTNVNVTGPTSMTVDGFVQPTTAAGPRNLTVTTGTQVLGLSNAFYVSPGPAVINSVTPNSGGQGATLNVTVNGTNTNWQQGVTTLSFPGAVVNSLTVNSLNSMTANITIADSAPAGEVTLTATTLGEVATGVNVFTVTQTQPELLAVVSGSGAQGLTETVTVTGDFTNFVTGTTTANFGAGITINSVTATSATSLQVSITVQPTANTGARNVTVTTGTQVVSLTNAFTVTTGPAAITGLSPSTGAQGNSYSIIVTGSQTHFAQGVTTANFSGGATVTGITVTDLLHATVNITIPNNTPVGQYNVYLTTGGEVAAILPGFTVVSGSPSISAVNPPTGPQGAVNLNVQLTGLYTSWVNSASMASFGAGITVNSLTVSSETSATANITVSPTATLGSRNVTVTTTGQIAAITGGFTVLPGIPTLLTALPGTAQAGQSGVNVVITGQFTAFQQGFSTVSFGSGVTVNFVTVNSFTQLTANISVASNAGVGSRDVSVTTNGATQTLTDGFTVTAGTPVITQISPNFGNPGQSNLAVTIYGQYTNWVNGTTVASFGPSINVVSTVVSSPTQLVVTITIPSGTAVGPVGVTTTTHSEIENVPGGFTVQAAVVPAPTLLSLSPGANAGGMPINSNLMAVFSEPMNRTTITASTVLLTLVSNPNGQVSVPGTVTVDATGRVMTFTPASLLAVNSQFYLQLTNSIKDATGNTFSNYSVYLYTTDAANTAQPTVVAANPPANATGIGTNVLPQLEFSADMDQATTAGMTLSTGGNPVAGTFTWNSYPYGSPMWGPGTVLTFTPATPLAANTNYTVSYNATLTDTAGNALVPGSFSFTTGSGADTVTNNSSADFTNNLTNAGTNFAPRMNYAKPINPIDINASTLLLYNEDSGKYIGGTVTVAPNGLSATFTPSVTLLPNTYYRLYQAGGAYDADGNTLNGSNWYFTTGAGQDMAAPQVAAISPANNATSVPLNAEVIVHFSAPVDPDSVSNAVTLAPTGGGSAIAGTATLASDMVTLFFVPTTTAGSFDSTLQPGTQYTISVSGYQDVVGNAGVPFSSAFTTATSIATVNVSTGLNAAGSLITTNNTNDGHWVYVATAGTPSESTFGSPASGTAVPLQTVGTGDTGFYSGWPVNGPSSDWIDINPNSVTGNTNGLYYTTFNLPNPLPSYHLCLVGQMGVDDNGLLAVNGNAIMGNVSAIGSLTPISVDITSWVAAGSNTLSLGWGSTDNNDEAFRLQAVVEACGASYASGLTLSSATPAYGSTGNATNTNIMLTFNNTLDPATVNSTTLPVMVGFNSNQEIAGNYVVTGNQVVFTPDTPFPVSTQIWVGAYNGPYDLAGDSAASGVNNYTQLTYFTTGTTATAPSTSFQVVANSPSNGATNVGLRAPVSFTFNRSINLSSVNSTDFALFAGDGQSPWCTSMSHSQDDTTILFNCYPLPSNDTMTSMLGSGLSDWLGDTLTATNYQFSTAPYDSNVNGSVTATRPGNTASGISTAEPLTLYFNLPISAASAGSGIQVAENNVNVPGSMTVTDNGYTLVFTPSSNWTPGALVQWWTTGSLMDTTYNTPVNTTSGYFYVAASTSTLAPAVQVISPSNGSSGAGTNAIVDLQFNTPLNPSTVNATNIYIYNSTTGLHVAGTYSMPQPNEVRIVPSAPLSPSAYMYVYETTGLQSSTSVPVASQTDQYFYTGASTDTTLPTIVSAVPYNGATNVGVNVAPGVVISKTIDPVSVNNSTFTVTNGGTPLAGNFYFSGNDTRVQFVPYAALPTNTNLVMTLNGVLDLVGNPINFTSSFTTGVGPDFNAPTVLWTSVSSNESIPTNSSITIQFSESMDVTTFSTGANGDIYIYDTLLGIRVPATLTWSADQSTAYLMPTSPLSAGREYYFYVNSGTDLAGNQVSGIETTFYAEFTGATSAPAVVAFNPLSAATGLGTNAIIEAEFSASVDPNTLGSVKLTTGGTTVPTSPSLSAGNTVLQLMPYAPLSPNTTYVMTIAGVKDPVGNAVATTTNTFTTGATFDNTAATAINSDPAYNSTAGTNVVPKLVFNKPLNPITVNNSTFRMYLYDTGQWIPLTVTLSASGMEVTMTPQIALLPNTRYYFQGCCGFQDQDGNNGNSVTEYFWTNGGAASSGPTVSVSPANSATAIPLNAQVIASISAPVDPTTVGQNAIAVSGPGNSPVAGTVTEVNTQQINFAPTNPLAASTTYTVKINNFTDANGNAVMPSTTTFTTGTAASTGGLTFTGGLTSNDGGALSAYNVQICLTFSQILDPTTVNANTLKVMNGWNSNYGLAGTYTVGGLCGANPVSGNTVVFTPANPYPAGATIYVGECGGPTDILGDVFQNGSCYAQQLISFTTPGGSASDTTPLTVVSVSPAANATNVRPDTAVSVTFNKAINPSSANGNSGNNALLFAGQGLQDRGSITMSADDRTMTFNSGTLSTGMTYTIQLPAGGISDPSGNALATTFSTSFVTGNNPATGNGSVQGTTPGSNASSIPTDTLLTLYMNRQVNPSTLPGNLVVTVNGAVYAGVVSATADNYEVQFTPTTAFPTGATVQWFFSGNVLDVNGDAFNGTSGYFYTVAAVNATTAQPTLVAISPADGTSNVPTNAQVDLLYSLPINEATVTSANVYLYDATTGAYPAVTLSMPTTELIRMVPNAALTPNQYYYVCVNSSVLGTNGVATQGNCWETYFLEPTGATTSTTAGTVTIGPPNSSVNVGTNAYIRLQFSKPVDRTSVNTTTVQVTTGGNPIPGVFTFNYSGNDVVGVNFFPVNPLPPSSTIAVTASGLLDYAGNVFTAASSSFITAAYPDYSTPTVTLDFGGGATGVATNASFTCLYSEPIDPSSISSSNTYVYSYLNSAAIPVTYSWAADLMAVTMTPVTPLFANTEYNYYCGGGIDVTGNGQSAASSYFYTGSGPSSAGPILLLANPPSGSTNVPLNSISGPWNNTSLMLLFNEPVATESMANITFTPQGGSAEPIAVYPQDGNYIAVVQLPWALAPNITYTFNTTGVTDINGNPASGTTTSSFTTGTGFDWNNPSITAVTPANSSTSVAVNAPLTVTFNEVMDPVLIQSNDIYLRTHNTQTTVPTTLAISYNGSGNTVVTLTPTTPLAASTIYDIVVTANNWYLYDIAGNYFPNNGVQSTFTTGTATAVNGACGTANGQALSTAPTASAALCSAGTASAVLNTGTWSWSCAGEYSGTTASCSATVTGTPACSPQLASLVSLWPGNNNATDFGPGANNGTLENGVSYGLGEVGDAFSFNGSNQYVLIGEPVPANLQIQSAITLSAWIYPTAYPTDHGSGAMAMIAGSQIDGVYGGATIFYDGRVNPDGGQNNVPTGHIQFNLGDGSTWHPQDTETQVPLNQWTLITATATSGGAGQVYYNGVLQPSNSGSYTGTWGGTISYPSSDWFAIGQEVNENRPFTGLINDVQVYNAALTPAQITAIYNAGSGGVCQ